jgi:hypothetical protein
MVTVAKNLSSENVKIDTFPAALIERIFGDPDGDESGGALQLVNRARRTSKY